MLDADFSLEFLTKHEHVLLIGPAGVGKSFLTHHLGYAAVRAGHTVRFVHSDDFFMMMSQARVDNSLERTSRSPDLQMLNDLWLHRLTAQQSADLTKLILNRHRGVQLRNRQQPSRGGMTAPLRRPHARRRRPRPVGTPATTSHRGLKLPGKTVPTPEVAGLEEVINWETAT